MKGSFKRKKLLTTVITIVHQFLSGAEYGIIFPSAWAYLQTLGVTEEYWLGYTLSAYSLSSGIASVVGGRLADIYVHHTKSIVLVSIALLALGNIQYALGIGLWSIICGRLLCGVGSAAASAMTSELCRVTEVEERTPILAVCTAAKQIGIFIGPAFQLLFGYCHFSVFGILRVNPLNAAGAFMGVVWLMFLVAALGMYYNLTAELEEIQKYDAKNGKIRSGHDGVSASEIMRDMSLKNKERAKFSDYINEFLTDTFVLLQFMVFSLYFCVMAFETTVPMVMQEYFGCGVYEVGYIYMGSAMAGLIVYSSLAFLSKHVRDSTLQLSGFLLFTAAHVLLIVVVPLSEQGKPIHVGYFVFGVMLLFFGWDVATIGNSCLTAKVLSGKTQGLGQGMRRLLGSIGLIFGPLWGGSTMKQPYWLLGVPMVILLLNWLMLAASFSELRRVEDEMGNVADLKKVHGTDGDGGEDEPLLSDPRQQ